MDTALRIETLRSLMAPLEIDTMMVSQEENRYYLSAFTGEDNSYDESAGSLFITDKKLLLATDSRFVFQAQSECKDFEIYCYKKGLAAELPDILKKLGTKNLGFEPARLSLKTHELILKAFKENNIDTKLIPVNELIESIRAIKDKKEIETIRKALIISEKALKKIMPELKEGITEKEAAWLLEKEVRENGAEGLSFPTITAFGINSAKPHARPSDAELKADTPVLFDWGIRLNHYCSDITRSFFYGKTDSKFMKIFNIVKTAQEKATEAIREGVSASYVDSIAREHIAREGYGDYFGHGLGHGVGLAIHEAPSLSPLSRAILQEGMIVTVEPGIYLPEWGGIRLENMVLVRKDGPEILNSTTVEDFLL